MNWNFIASHLKEEGKRKKSKGIMTSDSENLTLSIEMPSPQYQDGNYKMKKEI